MPVRPTENHIPNGLQASDLGQHEPKGDYILISYLTEPLKYEEDKKPIRNTYVVFDTRNLANTSNPDDYRWKFEFDVEGQAKPVEVSDLKGIEGGGVFTLDSSEGDIEDALEGKKVKKITITVSVDGNAANNITMEQDVEGLDKDIEDLIKNPSDEPGAVAGEPNTTRKLANDYKDYLIELGNAKGELELAKVSLNLLATLLYQAIESDANPDEEDWVEYANNKALAEADPGPDPELDFEDLEGKKMSILNVKPHIFYYLHKDPVGANPYEDYVFDEEQEDLDSFEVEILTTLNALNADEIVDLVNRLRFPKSCLYGVWTYLKHLKERHSAYLSNVLDKDNHSTNRECISTVVTEFEVAPQDNLDEPSSTAVQAYDVMYSQWMQEILDISVVQMEIIKVKVIDIRSGGPISNARVRKIVVYGEQGGVISKYGTNGEVDLLYDRDVIVENDALCAAQIALLRLGYAPAPTNRENANEELPAGWCNGVWGAPVSQAYNLYWQHRILNNSMNAGATPADKPSNRNLREIKNDYNGQAYTDERGVLEVRIPKIFVNEREIFIDVQFWEFPIVREEISDDSGDPITRSTTDENTATDFKVTWVGGTGANQRINWSDYILNNQVVESAEFGWDVSKDDRNSKLKAVQRLIVKDDENVFDEYNTDLLSKFYDADSYPIHFVLFGMVWCQPAWDEFEDPEIPAVQDSSHVYISEDVYCNDDAYNLLTINGYTDNALHTTTEKNFHIVANVNMNTNEPLRQKGYGVLDNRPDPDNARTVGGHSGYDIYNIDDTPVFAMHGGKAESRNDPGGFGRYTRVLWENNRIDFTHLRAVNPRPARFPAENTVPRTFVSIIAGEVIGYAGWSGNLNTNQPQHTHVRYRAGSINGPWAGTVLTNPPGVNDPNRFIIPHNELGLIFPCKCNYGVAAGVPTGCEFQNTVRVRNNRRAISQCFAPIELCCPFMNVGIASNKAPQKIQSQLKHIWLKGLDPLYMDPETIDGLITPANVNNRSTADLTNGTAVVRLAGSEHGGRLIQIQHTQNDGQVREGWIENSLLDAANQLQISAWYGVTALNNIIENPVGKSRMAIYMFRRANSLLDFNHYASNFSIDNQAWMTLNTIAPIRTPQ